MFTDRDFYRSVLAGALESFDLEKLASLGMPLEWERVLAIAGDAAAKAMGQVVEDAQ